MKDGPFDYGISGIGHGSSAVSQSDVEYASLKQLLTAMSVGLDLSGAV